MLASSFGDLAFLYSLLKRNYGKISVLVYRKPTHTDQYLHYSSHHQTSCKEILERLFKEVFKRITNNHSLPQSQQQTHATDIQEEEIKMSINLPYVKGTSEKQISQNKIHFLHEVNLKIELLQKIKTISCMKLTVVTVK